MQSLRHTKHDATQLTSRNEPQSGLTEGAAAKRQPALGLFVPPQVPPPPDSFLLDPKQTEAWFEALPKANIGETARRVYSALVDFNRMELAPALRARNAEQFREPVDYICHNLRRHFVDTGMPLRDKGQKAAALARALYQEMSISYKAIIQDQLQAGADRFDRKLLIIALHRAEHYLGEVMCYSALGYGPWPNGLWREINAIFAFALQNGIHQIKVRDSQRRDSHQNTLEEVYKGTLMFATAAPHRLRQGQQLALAEALHDWTPHATLGLPDEGTPRAGQFQVDLFSDTPPLRDAPDAPAAKRRLRRLDLRPVLKVLREQFDATPWQGGAGSDTRAHSLSRQLLRTLIQSWSGDRERRFVRTRLNFELQVIIGLNNLHDHQSHRGPVEEEEAESGDRYASSFLRHEDTVPIDPWSEPYNHGLGGTPLAVEAEAFPESVFTEGPLGSILPDSVPSEMAPSKTEGHAVRTLNESAGGYCIHWKGDDLPRVRIGELLGVQSGDGQGEYSLAAIRWLRQLPGQALQFGVEVLAPQFQAGEVTPSGESRRQYPGSPQRCLVIRPPGDRQDGCILLPSALYAVDTMLKLSHHEERSTIRLSQVVETTGAYARYQYEPAQGGGATAGSGGDTDDFGDLWNSL